MALFFIEMGQGIVVDGDVHVCTSTLYSCSLITGWNQNTGAAGAYHYPSKRITSNDVLQDMNAWAARLQPTHVTLIVAQAMNSMEVHAFGEDELALANWVQNKCGVVPTIDHQTAAAMCMVNGAFSAGRPSLLPGGTQAFNRGSAISVINRQAGVYMDHGGFTLVGHDREHAPAVNNNNHNNHQNAHGHKASCCIIL